VRKIGISFQRLTSLWVLCGERGDDSMTKPHKSHLPVHYRIKLKGHLDNKWSDWFAEMAISSEGGETILTGKVADQAALHGLLIQIRDLNLTLLAVQRIEPDQEDKQ
jgi:hypothetical protein